MNLNRKIIISPKDELYHLKDPTGEAVLYLPPDGVHQINEVSDYIVQADGRVKYHIHKLGYELFVITSGSVEAILGGKRCVAEVGDMLLIKPWMPHAFRYREDNTVWQEVIQQLALYENELKMERIIKNCPEKLDDPDFMRYYQFNNHRIDYPGIPAMDTALVEPDDMPGLVRKNHCYKQFNIPGITCHLKFPRWELDGIKEVWEFVLAKDTAIRWDRHYHSPELFILRKGRLRVEVQGYEPMEAAPGDIITIPDYTAHSITALEDGTLVQDFNCQHDLFLLLEEIAVKKAQDPSCITADYLKDAFVRYDCPITAITGIIEL